MASKGKRFIRSNASEREAIQTNRWKSGAFRMYCDGWRNITSVLKLDHFWFRKFLIRIKASYTVAFTEMQQGLCQSFRQRSFCSRIKKHGGRASHGKRRCQSHDSNGRAHSCCICCYCCWCCWKVLLLLLLLLRLILLLLLLLHMYIYLLTIVILYHVSA